MSDSKAEIAKLKDRNNELWNTILELQQAFLKALDNFLNTLIQYRLATALFTKVVELCGGLMQFVQSFKDVLQAHSAIPEDVSIGSYLAIDSQDYGYPGWRDKTADSSWIESYVVASHLPNASAVQRSDRPVAFPDFLYVSGSQVEDDRGLSEWLRSGFPSSFPTGELAHTGFRSWSGRFMRRLELVFDFCSSVRRLVVPGLPDDFLEVGESL